MTAVAQKRIVFACTSCGATNQVRAEMEGRRGRCRACKQVVRVPGSATGSTPARTAPRSPTPRAEPSNPCVDCAKPLQPGLERCGSCTAAYVSPTGAWLRLGSAVLLATAGWLVLVAIGAAVLGAGGLHSDTRTYSGKGPATLLALPTIGLLYASDELRKFRGAPAWAGAIPALPIPVIVAGWALLRAIG